MNEGEKKNFLPASKKNQHTTPPARRIEGGNTEAKFPFPFLKENQSRANQESKGKFCRGVPAVA